MPWLPSVIWLALLILFAAAEGITVGLVSLWFAAGALAALLVSVGTPNIWIQITVFLAVSFLCLLLVRPIARKYLVPRRQATNADRVIGAEGVVAEPIDNLQAMGQVKVQGAFWSARSEDDRPIPAETKVRIRRIEGVKLIVVPLVQEEKGGD